LTAVLNTGPGHGILALNANGSFTYTPSAGFSGTDSFSYRAYDGTANSDAATVSITVRPSANQAPVVNAGADQTVALANKAQLAGSVSDDGLPSGTLTVKWLKVSGPGSVTFGNAASPNTTAKFSKVGIYILRLTASDGQLASSDDVTVNVTKR
jgi:VCBS repeat-containing protein